MRAWVVLLVSAVLEAVWATALGASEGLTRPGPTVVFLVFSVLSLAGLGWVALSTFGRNLPGVFGGLALLGLLGVGLAGAAIGGAAGNRLAAWATRG